MTSAVGTTHVVTATLVGTKRIKLRNQPASAGFFLCTSRGGWCIMLYRNKEQIMNEDYRNKEQIMNEANVNDVQVPTIPAVPDAPRWFDNHEASAWESGWESGWEAGYRTAMAAMPKKQA
jgi:hypothetical protein